MENCILVNKPICHTLLKTMQMQLSFIAILINHKTELALLTLIGQSHLPAKFNCHNKHQLYV